MNETNRIQKEIGIIQVLAGHNPVCENISVGYGGEMDVMSLSKAGYSYEFEVKISRSDFLRDKRKHKFVNYFIGTEGVCPNYFSYACPIGMILQSDIPDWAGLYYYQNGAIKEIRKPKILHKRKRDRIKVLDKVCRLQTERHFLGCARLTYENNLTKKHNAERGLN